jgi:hypothetical protein
LSTPSSKVISIAQLRSGSVKIMQELKNPWGLFEDAIYSTTQPDGNPLPAGAPRTPTPDEIAILISVRFVTGRGLHIVPRTTPCPGRGLQHCPPPRPEWSGAPEGELGVAPVFSSYFG